VVSNLFTWNGAALKELAKCTWEEIRADDVFGRAAQLAYYFFFGSFSVSNLRDCKSQRFRKG
jgi:uncharacterized BrkB/YihY/UPF0761 family membrane protein